jgi:hypothetical protein
MIICASWICLKPLRTPHFSMCQEFTPGSAVDTFTLQTSHWLSHHACNTRSKSASPQRLAILLSLQTHGGFHHFTFSSTLPHSRYHGQHILDLRHKHGIYADLIKSFFSWALKWIPTQFVVLLLFLLIQNYLFQNIFPSSQLKFIYNAIPLLGK